MKLCNFLRFDPGYAGTGLQRGGKLEEVVWKQFAKDPDLLNATAKAILAGASLIPPPAGQQDLAIDEEERFPEGRLLTQLHKRRERNPTAARKKKQSVLAATSSLVCEACGFDSHKKYGDLGAGFAECHHREPLCVLLGLKKTVLKDLAIVCANCHRMLHRSRPWMTTEELAAVIENGNQERT